MPLPLVVVRSELVNVDGDVKRNFGLSEVTRSFEEWTNLDRARAEAMEENGDPLGRVTAVVTAMSMARDYLQYFLSL